MSAIDMIAITIIVTVAILTAPSYARSPMKNWYAAAAGTDGAPSSALEGPTSFVPPGTLRFRAYVPGTTDLRISDVVGLEVYNLRNEKIGLIVDVMLGSSQIVKGFVINVGGFLGMGNHNIAVTSRSILLLRRGGKLDRALVDVTRETLRKSEPFEFPAAEGSRRAVSDTPPGTRQALDF
ncbi:PRC-barrel domain-containing protein [Bradyrhizobium icense]|nr:PRC-barrel domain-containing protein [Bradyrhizobium icense]